MNKIALCANLRKQSSLPFVKDVCRWLTQNGCTVMVDNSLGTKLHLQKLIANDMFEKANLVVVLGGDGTILKAAKLAAVYHTPLLGINLGRLGYLTDVEKPQAFSALSKVLQGKYTTECRLMLEACGGQFYVKNHNNIALNEVSIQKAAYSKMITVKLSINDEYIDTYRTDGIIVSTPTGSTAYNLSAGGPIIPPSADVLAITLICPHTIYARPFVVSANDVIKIKAVDNKRNESALFLDGQSVYRLEDNEEITITKSSFFTSTIRTTNLGFYDILRQKMVAISH